MYTPQQTSADIDNAVKALETLKTLATLICELGSNINNFFDQVIKKFEALDSKYIATSLEKFYIFEPSNQNIIDCKKRYLLNAVEKLIPYVFYPTPEHNPQDLLNIKISRPLNTSTLYAELDKDLKTVQDIFTKNDQTLILMLNAYRFPTTKNLNRHPLENNISDLIDYLSKTNPLTKIAQDERSIKNVDASIFYFLIKFMPLLWQTTDSLIKLYNYHQQTAYQAFKTLLEFIKPYLNEKNSSLNQRAREMHKLFDSIINFSFAYESQFPCIKPIESNELSNNLTFLTNNISPATALIYPTDLLKKFKHKLEKFDQWLDHENLPNDDKRKTSLLNLILQITNECNRLLNTLFQIENIDYDNYNKFSKEATNEAQDNTYVNFSSSNNFNSFLKTPRFESETPRTLSNQKSTSPTSVSAKSASLSPNFSTEKNPPSHTAKYNLISPNQKTISTIAKKSSVTTSNKFIPPIQLPILSKK